MKRKNAQLRETAVKSVVNEPLDFDIEDDANNWIDSDEEAEMIADQLALQEMENAKNAPNSDTNPFMDSFYGLSASSARERAQAAHTLLSHCLTNERTAHAQDAAYALKRLLNGLCSGRATARQGNASALASFLQVAYQSHGWAEIRRAYAISPAAPTSDAAFVRECLLSATESPVPDAKSGAGIVVKTKGSEERDYQFGRLFGINAIVRSGILGREVVHTLDDTDSMRTVTLQLAQDLVALYQSKKWLREPAAHALCTMLSHLYAATDDTWARATARDVVDHVVRDLLQRGDHERRAAAARSTATWASFSAEQLGLALFIQLHHESSSLPSPLDQVVLTKETIPLLAAALSETSSVTQPRTHLVWDAFFLYISQSGPITAAKKVLDVRTARLSLEEECLEDIVEAVLYHVVLERLLGMDVSAKSDETESKGKTTHERRALALCLVRNLLGIEFMSSISGRTQIRLEPELIERVVLSPVLVQRLFTDVICAGNASRSKPQTAHLLKPLALQILGQCVESLCLSTTQSHDGEHHWSTRLSVALALLRCDARFDLRTKTNTVESLVGLDANVDVTADLVQSLWEPYIKFLMERVVSLGSAAVESAATTVLEAQGCIDLLFQFGKRLARSEPSSDSSILASKTACLYRIFAFLLTTAFFDCGSCVNADPVATTPNKKKKEKKQSKVSLQECIAFETAIMVRDARVAIPYDVRMLASARFFSLVTECVTTQSRSINKGKEDRIQELLTVLYEMQASLIKLKAKKLSSQPTPDDMETENGEDPETVVKRLQIEAKRMSSDTNLSNERWARGCAMLASTLHLHLLSCGQPDVGRGNDYLDTDEDEDVEDVHVMLSELGHVSSLYSKGYSEDNDPLLAMAEICASILSSPFGAGNKGRGSSPTLLREIVKYAWTGGLSMSAHDPQAVLSQRVVNVLLNAIGAIDESDENSEDDEDDEGEGDGEDESGEGSDGEGLFSSDREVPEVRDDESEVDDDESADQSEMELDPSKLQSMLEEDIDADIDEGELEHHEGADAALAKLIQLKQDARKAGQLARERSEIARQMRCVVLLETLVLGKADSWGSLLNGESVLGMVIPILQYRKELVKSLTKATTKGANAGSTEKRAMLERLTALVKTKILKVRVSDLNWTDSDGALDGKRKLAAALVEQERGTDEKEHQSLCNSALIMLLRSIADVDTKLMIADIYSDLVTEWAEKRSRVDVTVFEGLIQTYAVLAQACLAPALASAARNGRSSFVKSEAFRLLTTLYNAKLNPNVSELDKVALDKIVAATETVAISISESLKDPEMRKTKRVREVLKTADRVVGFFGGSSRSPPAGSLTHFADINELVVQLKSESQSNGICKSAEALSGVIDDLLSNKSSTPAADGADTNGKTSTKTKPKSNRKKRK